VKLLTKAIEKKLPALNSQDHLGLDQKAVVKFFTPWSNWTWYASEYDPEEKMFYGLVDGFEKELGSWRLSDLEEVNGPFGLMIERDLHFEPVSLKTLLGGE
jgi:hypothetical protein